MPIFPISMGVPWRGESTYFPLNSHFLAHGSYWLNIYWMNKGVKVKVIQCLTLCDPMNYTVHGILQTIILEWVAFPFSRGSSYSSRDRSQLSHIAGRFFASEPQGKPKNTGVGSLSFLQRIFLTQESNWGLLHCRWILYHLSYKGSFSFFLRASILIS